jgi:hypothetical protein
VSGYIALSDWQLAAASVFVLLDASLSVGFGLKVHFSLLFAAVRNGRRVNSLSSDVGCA